MSAVFVFSHLFLASVLPVVVSGQPPIPAPLRDALGPISAWFSDGQGDAEQGHRALHDRTWVSSDSGRFSPPGVTGGVEDPWDGATRSFVSSLRRARNTFRALFFTRPESEETVATGTNVKTDQHFNMEDTTIINNNNNNGGLLAGGSSAGVGKSAGKPLRKLSAAEVGLMRSGVWGRGPMGKRLSALAESRRNTFFAPLDGGARKKGGGNRERATEYYSFSLANEKGRKARETEKKRGGQRQQGSGDGNNGVYPFGAPPNVTRPPEELDAAPCSGAGFAIYFSDPFYLCTVPRADSDSENAAAAAAMASGDGYKYAPFLAGKFPGMVPVNATVFGSACGGVPAADDYESPQATADFNATCGCQRIPNFRPLCVCPADLMGETCSSYRPSVCVSRVLSPVATGCRTPRIPMLDDYSPCHSPVDPSVPLTFETRFNCSFTNLTDLELGTNLTRFANSLMIEPERVAEDPRADEAFIANVVDRVFQYLVFRRDASGAVFAVSRAQESARDLKAVLTLYNFRAPFSRILYNLPLDRETLALGFQPTIPIDVSNLPYDVSSGGRIFGELEIPFGNGPGGMSQSNVETIILDLDIDPPKAKRSGVSTGGAVAIAVVVILSALAAAGGVYYWRVYRRRRTKPKKD